MGNLGYEMRFFKENTFDHKFVHTSCCFARDAKECVLKSDLGPPKTPPPKKAVIRTEDWSGIREKTIDVEVAANIEELLANKVVQVHRPASVGSLLRPSSRS